MLEEIVEGIAGVLWATERHSSHSKSLSEERDRFSSLDRVAESFPPDPLRPIAQPIPGPIDTKRLPADFFFAHVSPEPAVQTLVAIVAHHEVGSLGDSHRSEIIARIDRAIDHAGVDSLCKSLVVERLAVHEHHLIAKLHGIPRQPNNALDEIFLFILRKSKYDDVTPLRFAECHHRLRGVAIHRGNVHCTWQSVGH